MSSESHMLYAISSVPPVGENGGNAWVLIRGLILREVLDVVALRQFIEHIEQGLNYHKRPFEMNYVEGKIELNDEGWLVNTTVHDILPRLIELEGRYREAQKNNIGFDNGLYDFFGRSYEARELIMELAARELAIQNAEVANCWRFLVNALASGQLPIGALEEFVDGCKNHEYHN